MKVPAVGCAFCSQGYDKPCTESGFSPEGVLNLLAMCWAVSLPLVLQTSLNYLVPKLPLSVRKICPAVAAGLSVPDCREGLCSLC